jgi:DNA-3-methyladenine glycosylase I
MKRCQWFNLKNELYIKYHDEEWGVPIHEDNKLFEMLILEGAQAGLSWETILKRRKTYRLAYKGFNPKIVSQFNDNDKKRLLADSGIIRNRLKVDASILNANIFVKIQEEFGSFDKYLWEFVDNKPIKNNFKRLEDLPVSTPLSDKISKDLKARGMKFVGSTIIYAYMQAIGLVSDHTKDCFKHIN